MSNATARGTSSPISGEANGRLACRPTAGDLRAASTTATARRASSTSGTGQLTLALTTGYHAGPLFIVRKRRAPIIHGGTLGGKRRRAREARATPKWLTSWQKAMIRLRYAQADRLTKLAGEMHVVDHIVPLEQMVLL